MEHISRCERYLIAARVDKRVNLSREESRGLFALEVEGSIICNCARWLQGLEERDLRTLERLTIDAVLQARARINHPSRVVLDMDFGPIEKRALEWMGREESKGDAQIIRIDFRNRRRII